MNDELMTTPQRKLFFALCDDLGYDKEEMKDRGKKRFNKDHFSDLTKQEAKELIDLLQARMS